MPSFVLPFPEPESAEERARLREQADRMAGVMAGRLRRARGRDDPAFDPGGLYPRLAEELDRLFAGEEPPPGVAAFRAEYRRLFGADGG